MDIAVKISMIFLVVVLVAVGIGAVKHEKHWTDWLAAICCFLVAAFIAYGLYIQCDNVVIFYSCGG